MDAARKPSLALAKKVLPKPLHIALAHLFEQGIQGCMLVGGTALSGFYAGHRRSDDLDLFTRDTASYKATVLAAKSLETIGVKFLEKGAETAQYFRSTCELSHHRFTIDVVLDSNLFRVGSSVNVAGIEVADLNTLLMTKAATLVSRCSEKDLYDLIWLFQQFPKLDFSGLIELGKEIDAGINSENILIALAGTSLAESACDFSLSPKITKQAIYKEILSFKKAMTKGIQKVLDEEPAPLLKELVQRVTKLKTRFQ
ncbi:nucleotidyl transferase AbiEii/AbiGii toxin family protein [Bdellovibrionota bacterium FG-2]